ncbi:Hypothetical protein I595_789 [Croceitalea dokdonensis DOKDO 023]|uniref:Uncharacterized protein n=1 Tax=Croceitalea dokdonensis DOKDO 023 TaxID=1300341 RepID=A0A0N8H448_9FLAO|nr:Hypothetical protein I595_789 [Croceitalea dokdonensis DOKDO 023]
MSRTTAGQPTQSTSKHHCFSIKFYAMLSPGHKITYSDMA